MILYHGSNVDIKCINLNVCRPYKDFGRGFYLTDIRKQAMNMAKRVSKMYGGIPVLNLYETEDDLLKNDKLNVLDFGNVPTKEWAIFVMNNRNRRFKDISSMQCNFDNKYDIVKGPVADDGMNMLFDLYEHEVIDLNELVEKMTYREQTSQYSFHSDKAITLLRKVIE